MEEQGYITGFLVVLVVLTVGAVVGYIAAAHRAGKGKKLYPWSKKAGTLVLLFALLLLPAVADAWTISWSPVTTYTDNTLIEASKMPVRYEIRRDGVLLAPATTATSLVFTDTGRGLTRSFTGKAILQTGEESSESAPYSWTVPLGVPKTPGGFSVQ